MSTKKARPRERRRIRPSPAKPKKARPHPQRRVRPSPTSTKKDPKQVFDNDKAVRLNVARQEHLASLGFDLSDKRVLEVGAGIGKLTGFFEDRDCRVISTDGRPENVQEHLRRYIHRRGRVEVADLLQPGGHDRFGCFDIVFCYGALYHTSDPALVLKDLARVCGGLFLLSNLVHFVDNGKINSVRERKMLSQSLDGRGCRPARDWLMFELRKHYEYVYHTKTQPDHRDYVLEWPPLRQKGVRAVFVASRQKLNLSTLSPRLLMKQERFQC